MRVSKIVREYIEKEVGIKAEIKRQAVHETFSTYETECKIMQEKIKQAVKALNDELLSEVKNKGMSFRRYNDQLVEAYPNCIYPTMENEIKKAMREVSDWKENTVTEIILTLELGGTKADLERMLKELD